MKISKPLVPLFIIIISLALLIPGVTQPILTLTGTLEKSQITETGIDLIIDSVVDKSLRRGKEKSEEGERKKVRTMIGTVLGMFGLKNITGEIEAYKETRSIVGTVKELFRSGNGFVAFLVMLFSIVIPVTKILLLLLSTYFQDLKISKKNFLNK
ncbi:MAG: Paraquat-inducible protein A [Candidatus Scalindua rubra]|uniref:Paraquat-inducible protein A n=1 Tax=Candidatus Scalindua rubra TaxID=1872076 RepID=A0A1E3XEM2_9BACT|nr:MAG: Paraquat-inducible protein A [Candidatus Scalindua rubra]